MTVPSRAVSIVQPGLAVARFIRTLGLVKKTSTPGSEIAEQWRDTPQVSAAFAWRTKADVGAASTLDSAFAGALADTGITAEALQILRGNTIYGALQPKMQRRPFRANTPRQTGAGTAGGWSGEGTAAPVVSYAFDLVFLEVFKASALYVVSDVLLQAAGPAGELMLRDVSLGALGGFIDDQFLNASVTGTVANPASIVAGATAVTSTGTTAAALTTDFGNLIAAITTSGRALTWIMRPTTLARVALILGGAASDVPRTLFGIPIIASGNSPQQVTLVDAGEIVYADDGGFDISLSQQATVEMESAPVGSSIDDGSPAGPTPTSLVSLFQTNCVGVKLTRLLNWERVRDGAVAYMPVTY